MKRGSYFGGCTIILAGEAGFHAPRAPKDIPAAKADLQKRPRKMGKSSKRRAVREKTILLKAQQRAFDEVMALINPSVDAS